MLDKLTRTELEAVLGTCGACKHWQGGKCVQERSAYYTWEMDAAHYGCTCFSREWRKLPKLGTGLVDEPEEEPCAESS